MSAVETSSAGGPGGWGAVQRLIWVGAICEVPALSNALRVATLLANKYLNSKTGEAWPSMETMAADLGVDVRTVRRWIKNLVEGGFLQIRSGKGRNGTNRYRMRFPNQLRLGEGDSAQDSRTFLSQEQGQICPINPMKEPIERTPAEGEWTQFQSFEEAWRWQVGDPRAPARKAFEELTEAERQQAIRFIPTYLADCDREGRKQCFAKTFLIEKRWEGSASANSAPETNVSKIWIEKDSPQWKAWKRFLGKPLQSTERRMPDGQYQSGWWLPSEWPPGWPEGER